METIAKSIVFAKLAWESFASGTCAVQGFVLSRRCRTCTSSCLILLRLTFRLSISVTLWDWIVGLRSAPFRISSSFMRAVTCSESSLIHTLYLSGWRDWPCHDCLFFILCRKLRMSHSGVLAVARGACQLVLFHVVPGALHINLFLRCEFGAHSIEGRRTSFAVFAKPEFKSLFEIRTR